MIIVKIIDGLGNQMFNYALGRSLSLLSGYPLKLDLTSFEEEREFPFTYKLHYFNIEENIASRQEIEQIRDGFHLNAMKTLAFKLRRRLAPYHRKPYVMERFYHFDPGMLNIRDKTYMAGLWQSEKYFKPIESQLRTDFQLKHEPDDVNQKFAGMIQSVNAVSIHHRRKEFAGDRGKKDHQVVMTQDYYDKALKIIEEKVPQPHLFIFSDEIDWVRENLKFNFPVVYVDHNAEEEKHIEDFRLLSLCKHNIISTSTFSWWSAWCNSNPEKIVIAPRTRFSGGPLNPKDVIPDSWIQI